MLTFWLGLAAQLGACVSDERAEPQTASGTETGIRFLAEGGTGGFARALQAREFEFPADHGGHPDFRTEWWYFTGNVFGAQGRHYGFELTFFRIALTPSAPARESAWATNQIWMAHFALTDVGAGRFSAGERLSRGALGIAGVRAEPFRVWVEDWSATAEDGRLEDGLRLRASMPEGAIDLRLEALKPAVPQGDGGLDAKGAAPGNASYYYSIPRLSVSGTVEAGGTRDAVEGLAWMDREWSTSALEAGVAGWDWFALQLSDGSDLMLYRLRDDHGGTTQFSAGTLVDANGAVTRFGATDFSLQAGDFWTSATSGARYPVFWRIRIPDVGLDLQVAPHLKEQEIDLAVRYWEGAVGVTGSSRQGSVSGHGYLELAGY